MASMDQFILFGDSITQASFAQDRGFAFGAALADIYTRRLDVINRGLSGYNSTQGFQALPLIMPDPEVARVRFLTIFFGANDARLPDTPGGPQQTVPLEDFVQNLRAMVKHPAVQRHKGIRIVLVMTPPVDERELLKHDMESYPGMGRVLRRTAVNTARYAQAVRELGTELGLSVLDIHGAMLKRAGYNSSTAGTPTDERTPGSRATGSPSSPMVGSLEAPPSDMLQSFLYDGLHFSGEGYKLLYGELMALIEEDFPDQMPTRLPFVLPAWDDGKAWGARNGSG